MNSSEGRGEGYFPNVWNFETIQKFKNPSSGQFPRFDLKDYEGKSIYHMPDRIIHYDKSGKIEEVFLIADCRHFCIVVDKIKDQGDILFSIECIECGCL